MSVLNTAEKQQVMTELSQRRAQLTEEIRIELERAGHQHFADLAGEVADVGDASVADALVDQDIAIVRRQVAELTQVEAAQKRVAGADFGECDECGAAIGVPRLLIVPHATRCVACQEQHDKMYAHESTPKM
ncbi:MAG TPA: TraR/DksA family transcriptional regulator [Methylophilaceae bacterium]|nr:TraR/DksA family transcriptional regulator [Methylophilaceae bacterium]